MTPAFRSYGQAGLALGFIALLAACGDGGSQSEGGKPTPTTPAKAVATDVGEPLEEPVTSRVGPEGGTLESEDGRLRIVVPEGTFAEEQTLSIQAVENRAHGKVGSAFRLGPEGATFAKKVRLEFYFSEENVLGTAPELLSVASQTKQGFWALHTDVSLDTDERTMAVEVDHFSDWSLVAGAQLSPSYKTIKPGDSVELEVVVCESVDAEEGLATLLTACRPSEVISKLVKNWSVNGNVGGSSETGTVTVKENKAGVYTAPAKAPAANPVAVSAEYTALDGARITLVANVLIQPGLCPGIELFEGCQFDLKAVNGSALPYKDLPREDWENQENVISGVLNLKDQDGNGEGTFSMRHVWVEERPSSELAQFIQIAGNFTSKSDGSISFELLGGGGSFTGTLMNGEMVLEGCPLSTKNASIEAQLTFAQ